MEVFVAIVIAFGGAWLIGNLGAASIDSAVSAIAQFVGGWRGDGWPRGVQEEDPDHQWGTAAPGAPKLRLPIPDLKPALTRVKPQVHTR